MSFENYECDGQLSFDDLYPKQCCGLNPWLHKTRCWMDGREDLEQEWLMYYICPKCKKTAVDAHGWTIRSGGTYEQAKASALETWNDPKSKFDSHMFSEGEKLRIPFDEQKEFLRTYGDAAREMGILWSD